MTEPIRILRVVGRLNVGGPALHVAYLSAGLAERGYETTLVAGSVGRGEDTMTFVAESLGVPVVRLGEMRRDISPLRDAIAVTHLVRLIKETRPHILHTHMAKAGAVGRLAALASGEARPPVVLHTFHGHVLRHYFDPVRTAAFRMLEHSLARTTTALVAVSPQVRDELVELGVAPAKQFAVVRLGIELAERVGAQDGRVEQRRLLGIAPDRFVVGWIGRMTEVKRTDDVLLAFRQLRANGIDACLCLVGDGPDRPAIERRAHELGIMRDTLFLGFQKDVAPFYAAFDALLLPSVSEGTPVSAIEALAAGRPVVATRVGGVPDVVRDGEEGLLAEPGAIEELSEGLASLARDPELRERMGAAGRERVTRRYRVDRLVDEMDLLYRSLLEASSSSSRTSRPAARGGLNERS
jgi:glycosyltransferase involved in cell wall biosynthesis